ncbi:RNA chaperone Hfq [Paraburkholderia dilworthii]|uniref:RNA chaperone Hfq n=1 Tax=Paraburkholderia dilworthii TaxID=948106 RepID=UPI001FCC32CA
MKPKPFAALNHFTVPVAIIVSKIEKAGGFRYRRYNRKTYRCDLEHDRTPRRTGRFLQMLLNDKTTVNVFLVNGIRLSGQLAAFDQFAVLLESGPGAQLVFKHAISTVLPANGRSQARDPTEVPVSGDRPNRVRGRVR